MVSRFKLVRNKNKLKILIIGNFFPCHLMVMKLCTVIKLENTWPKLKLKFCNGHRFHGNRSMKLTKKCLKASFLECLLKEYQVRMKRFWSFSSLGGNTRNKSASFSCLHMRTRPHFRIFSTFHNLDYRISKIIKANSCGFICDNKKGPLNKCAKFHWNTVSFAQWQLSFWS